MKIYKKIKLDKQSSKDDVLKILNQYHKQGKKVYCDFNGFKLYSDKINNTCTQSMSNNNKKILSINL